MHTAAIPSCRQGLGYIFEGKSECFWANGANTQHRRGHKRLLLFEIEATISVDLHKCHANTTSETRSRNPFYETARPERKCAKNTKPWQADNLESRDRGQFLPLRRDVPTNIFHDSARLGSCGQNKQTNKYASASKWVIR